LSTIEHYLVNAHRVQASFHQEIASEEKIFKIHVGRPQEQERLMQENSTCRLDEAGSHIDTKALISSLPDPRKTLPFNPQLQYFPSTSHPKQYTHILASRTCNLHHYQS
jgi:hypothetical protein